MSPLHNPKQFMEPPSHSSNAQCFNLHERDQTSSKSLHTVTADKTFYVSSLVLSAFNTSITSHGELLLRENANDGDRASFLMPTAGTRSQFAEQSLTVVPMTFAVPLEFAAGKKIKIAVKSGIIRWSALISGWEA